MVTGGDLAAAKGTLRSEYSYMYTTRYRKILYKFRTLIV